MPRLPLKPRLAGCGGGSKLAGFERRAWTLTSRGLCTVALGDLSLAVAAVAAGASSKVASPSYAVAASRRCRLGDGELRLNSPCLAESVVRGGARSCARGGARSCARELDGHLSEGRVVAGSHTCLPPCSSLLFLVHLSVSGLGARVQG